MDIDIPRCVNTRSRYQEHSRICCGLANDIYIPKSYSQLGFSLCNLFAYILDALLNWPRFFHLVRGQNYNTWTDPGRFYLAAVVAIRYEVLEKLSVCKRKRVLRLVDSNYCEVDCNSAVQQLHNCGSVYAVVLHGGVNEVYGNWLWHVYSVLEVNGVVVFGPAIHCRTPQLGKLVYHSVCNLQTVPNYYKIHEHEHRSEQVCNQFACVPLSLP